MSYVTAKCGCEVEVELDTGWDYGCAGDCCPSVQYTVVESAEILQPCAIHGG